MNFMVICIWATSPELSAVHELVDPAGRFSTRDREKISAESVEPFFKVTDLRVGVCQRARLQVGGACLVTASEPADQVGSRRMREIVVPQLTAGQKRIDERQPGGWPLVHRDRHGAVELDDR